MAFAGEAIAEPTASRYPLLCSSFYLIGIHGGVNLFSCSYPPGKYNVRVYHIMSATYDFLFKFIVIGDTSTFWWFSGRCWEELPFFALHGGQVQSTA
jgi:hypothetical protein